MSDRAGSPRKGRAPKRSKLPPTRATLPAQDGAPNGEDLVRKVEIGSGRKIYSRDNGKLYKNLKLTKKK